MALSDTNDVGKDNFYVIEHEEEQIQFTFGQITQILSINVSLECVVKMELDFDNETQVRDLVQTFSSYIVCETCFFFTSYINFGAS